MTNLGKSLAVDRLLVRHRVLDTVPELPAQHIADPLWLE